MCHLRHVVDGQYTTVARRWAQGQDAGRLVDALP